MAVFVNNSYSESFNLFEEDSYSTVRVNSNKESNSMNETIIPFIKLIEEEVRVLSKKKQKKFFNMIKVASLAIIPLSMTQKANAQMIQVSARPINIPLIENKKGLGIIPSEIFEILVQLITSSMILGMLLSMLLLIVAGGLKMAGQGDKSHKWMTDILKGLGVVLLAPALIILLVTIVSMTLKNVDGLNVFY